VTKREAYAAVVVALKRYRNNPTPKAAETLLDAVMRLVGAS
jgi:hypothetical protein